MPIDQKNSPIRRTIASTTAKKLDYRPDIDGLRAIAVLSVVIYHLRNTLLPGGFVGVDIFFVISGFLITKKIWNELCDGNFSFRRFYLHRIRRIAPAFLVMAAVVLFAGSFVLLPADLLTLARSTLWAAASSSNIYFWKYLDNGYFAQSSDEEAMLHTWSLGVEEQFYFIWPAALLLATWLFSPRRRTVLTLAGVISIASFVCAELTNTTIPKFAYFMLPSRAGELMLGAILATCFKQQEESASAEKTWLAEVIAIAGFASIFYSMTKLNDNSPFPGVNSLYPCIGSALIILAGQLKSRITSMMLTPRPVVYIGLISYSLYLWHWPILAFSRYFLGDIDLLSGTLCLIAMGAAAALSYHYVEWPTRHWRSQPLRQALALYAIPTAAIALYSGLLISNGGFKHLVEGSTKYMTAKAELDRYTSPANESVDYNCIVNNVDPTILGQARCITGKPLKAEEDASTLLWGDSLAAHYIGTVSTFANKYNFSIRNATHSACPPVFGDIDYGMPRFHDSCTKFRRVVQKAILEHRYKMVIMSGGWFQYDQYANFRNDLTNTIKKMTDMGIHIVLIGQTPWMQNYNRYCPMRGARLLKVSCEERTRLKDSGDTGINLFLSNMAKQFKGIDYLSARSILCHDGICTPYVDGHPIFYNASHMSISGSWTVGDKLLNGPQRDQWAKALSGQEMDF